MNVIELFIYGQANFIQTFTHINNRQSIVLII
jgi:hypothetical protein